MNLLAYSYYFAYFSRFLAYYFYYFGQLNRKHFANPLDWNCPC